MSRANLKLLADIKYAINTLPDTNCRKWAMIAQLELRKKSFRCIVVVEGDIWTLHTDYPDVTFMNIPTVPWSSDDES